jgi:hypothetical protein
MMGATHFEVRYRTLLHQLLVLAAFLTYLFDRDDIVWRFIKGNSADVRMLERAIFAVATILFGIAAWICTRARVHPADRSTDRSGHLGEFFYAVALGSLAPLAGFVILVAGEAVRLLRLAMQPDVLERVDAAAWPEALQREAVKWGLFFTMIVFTVTLVDRVAEVLAGMTVVIWVTLNARRVVKLRA